MAPSTQWRAGPHNHTLAAIMTMMTMMMMMLMLMMMMMTSSVGSTRSLLGRERRRRRHGPRKSLLTIRCGGAVLPWPPSCASGRGLLLLSGPLSNCCCC